MVDEDFIKNGWDKEFYGWDKEFKRAQWVASIALKDWFDVGNEDETKLWVILWMIALIMKTDNIGRKKCLSTGRGKWLFLFGNIFKAPIWQSMNSALKSGVIVLKLIAKIWSGDKSFEVINC